ncbi:indole-3-glycerol phosphate synthase [Palleronia aestuarii]|uniref:Indole-3-glycerol phosphate synthase n=1 Tax=Palleronia aestuarii TaxID=568105 RepID=A0A2W7NWQ6_9RHOB|nr:indole-3-glycerol phosphate synthase TrpC [Palleronia aestuarii]PZX17736.1 indole-3-glycerol phosphate synthase [Palleronia aestuarii]
MPTILDRIKDYKLEEIATRKSQMSQSQIENAARDAPPVRPFADRLVAATYEGYGLIAEVKKASPSKGLIREDFDPAALAAAYEEGGAACLSVLTDAPSFQGHEDFLVAARAATGLPVLRKDFIYDPWQVAEARSIGADCILVIMAAVDDVRAAEIEAAARDWRMDVLIEIHDEAELDRAMRLSSRLVGINNRDLHTFETSLETTKRLSRRVGADRVIVAESGLSTPEDLAELARYGARAFLVGEALMREDDVTAATRRLLADPHTSGLR